MSKLKSLQTVTVCGMLIALDVVLRRLMELGNLDSSYSLAFLAVAVAAYWYGPIAAGLVHGLADLIGAILFPKGPPHIGMMLTAALIGIIYGLFLYRKTAFWRIAAAVVTCQSVCSLLLNSYWLSTLMSKGFTVLLVGRLPQVCIMAVIQLVLLPLFLSQIKKLPLKH